MRILTLVRSEFARLTSSRMGLLALIALMTVPVVYGGLYLWGNDDPYNQLDQVPRRDRRRRHGSTTVRMPPTGSSTTAASAGSWSPTPRRRRA